MVCICQNDGQQLLGSADGLVTGQFILSIDHCIHDDILVFNLWVH
jgi:hypothetical protein